MNNIAKRALLLAILAFATPLFGVSPEYLVGGTVTVPAPGPRESSSVASDGTDFLVVWADRRAGKAEIIGTRITRAGLVLDPVGIRIASFAGIALMPEVVWDGTAYVVLWTELPGMNASYANSKVRAARVDRDGRTVMAPRTIAENAAAGDGRFAASNGSVTVVAYLSHASGPRSPARVVVLDRDGNTLRQEDIAGTSRFRTGLSVAATASRFVVAWSARTTVAIEVPIIEAIALNADGQIDSTAVAIGAGDKPAIATDGTRFTLVARSTVDSQEVLVSRTFNADLGSVSAPRAIASGVDVEAPALLWRGDRYEVIAQRWPGFPSKYDIASTELDRDGNPLATRSRGDIEVNFAAPEISAATNGTEVVVAWTSTGLPFQREDIVARIYRGSSTSADAELLLSKSGNAHRDPEIASSPFGHLVAWQENDGVFATRIDRQGNSLDGRGVKLAEYAAARVAFDGTNYVVAGHRSGGIGVRTIAPQTGATVADVLVPVANPQSFALAVSPDATYLAFDDGRIRVTRIPHATRTPDPLPLAVSPEEMSSGDPAVAWNGSTLLVTWNELYAVPRVDPPLIVATKVLAARVTGTLTLLDPAPLLLSSLDGGYSGYGRSSVASNGDDWLVTWHQSEQHVLARRVLRNGSVGEGPAIVAAGRGPAVTWDGKRYALAWLAETAAGAPRQVILSAVPPAGAIVATRRTMVAAIDSPLSRPSLASNGAVAVAYTRISNLPEHGGVERSYFRVMDFAPPKGRVVRR